MPEQNVEEQTADLAASIASVDKLNAAFYGKFPYPWPPMKFEYLLDPYFETDMLNQTLGSWENQALPKNPHIWVAGCGANQAIFTALKFPKATIIGSDISTTSLQTCAETAKQLGISNLELREESINQVTYRERFDLIVCTGVIHHNAKPQATLSKLAEALQPTGILELMVYNFYHFIVPAALQRAIRMLAGDADTDLSLINMESEFSIAKTLCNSFDIGNLVSNYLSRVKDSPDSMLADLIIQPVLYSYTVESLEELAASCALEILTPYIDRMDKAQGRHSWNIEFSAPELRKRYESTPDNKRWQIANLLLLEKSPMLWFYLQRKDSGRRRKSEKEICDDFLSTAFTKTSTTQQIYIKTLDGKYALSPDTMRYPIAAPDASVRGVVNAADPSIPMREIFKRLGLEMTFQNVNAARIKSTTSAFPYLRAASRQHPQKGQQ
jgi:SAM-dependent methyltransferase